MTKTINAEDFGLPKRTQLQQLDNQSITIVKQRKSRIIMKDGLQILDIAKQIRKNKSEIKLSLLISGPICSKTTKLLNDNDINIIQ